MLTSEILIAAKARLTPETWGKGDGTSNLASLDGYTCALTAIGDVDVFEAYDCDSAREFLARVLSVPSPSDIASWNDRPERTLAEVHAAFDSAIALAKAAESQQPLPSACVAEGASH